jgi:hypothetical protein
MQEAPCRFPPPWHADPMPGGSVVRDAPGRPNLYSRDNEAEARQAKVLTKDEARRIAVNTGAHVAQVIPLSRRSTGGNR